MTEKEKVINIIEGKPLYEVPFIENLKALLKRSAHNYGDKIAFNFRNEPNEKKQSKTYRELYHDVNSLGSALFEMGLSDSRIAVTPGAYGPGGQTFGRGL